jgi:hypothetical protein
VKIPQARLHILIGWGANLFHRSLEILIIISVLAGSPSCRILILPRTGPLRAENALTSNWYVPFLLVAYTSANHYVAFAFHRVAYAERMKSVRETLSVIETLRSYQPKQHHSTKSTGSRTPVFSGFGFGGTNGGRDGRGRTPLDEKEHYHSLSSALKKASNTNEDSAGEEGDDEDGVHKVTKKNKGKQKRRSFRPSEREDSNNTLRTATTSELPSRPASPSETNPNTHADSDSPHRYPPSTGSGPASKHSWDEGDTTLVAAVKVIKTAMLHDARNIKNEEGSKAMAWNVNSEYEARVFFFLENPVFISSLIDIRSRDSQSRSTTTSKTVKGPGLFHPISILLSPLLPTQKRPSTCLTKTATAIFPARK